MVPFIVFVSGVAVGVCACKLWDFLKENSMNIDISKYQQEKSVTQPIKVSTGGSSKLDISLLFPIMERYDVDIYAPNCLYILCNKIKSITYKKLLDDIVETTKTGEELIEFINKLHIETFTCPVNFSTNEHIYVSITTIDQLLSSFDVKTDISEPTKKVEMLINSAYMSAINRLKKNFGFELNRLLKAYENKEELVPYYNDIINEIKVSRDFIGA